MLESLMGLEEILLKKDITLYSSQQKTKSIANDLLKGIIIEYPEFTNHDIQHSEEIINIIDRVFSHIFI